MFVVLGCMLMWWNDLNLVCGIGHEQTWFDNTITWFIGKGVKIGF